MSSSARLEMILRRAQRRQQEIIAKCDRALARPSLGKALAEIFGGDRKKDSK